jgi:hypothetical protein
MSQWIITGALYAFGLGLFWILGGIGAAGEAMRNWGRTSSAMRGHSNDVMR